MAYVPDNLTMADIGIGGMIPRVFYYQTAADADATIVAAGYFSDGAAKGMRAGDLVICIATTGPKKKEYQVATVTAGVVTVAAVTAIT